MGNIFGNAMDWLGGGKESAASANLDDAKAQFDSVNAPSVEAQRVGLQRLVLEGKLSPEEAEAILLEASAMESVKADENALKAQQSALAGLGEIVESKGLTASDKLRLAEIENERAQADRGSREAILQNARQRGVAGSGMELANQMLSSQEGATRANNAALNVNAQAQQNALNALMNQANVGSTLANQSFNQAAQIAQAKDAINKYNTMNQQEVKNLNVANRNAAQEYNLSNAQSVANQNTSLANQQEMYNKGLIQQDFDNKLKKASGVAGVLGQQAAQNSAQAASQRQFIGGLAMSGATAFASDKTLKTDIKKVDASQFLDELTAYTFKYKNPKKHGEGKQFGVMAQDLEKSKLGKQAVVKKEDGKYVDTVKSIGPMLAALANLHERLKDIEEDK